jgi:hypothetical protein
MEEKGSQASVGGTGVMRKTWPQRDAIGGRPNSWSAARAGWFTGDEKIVAVGDSLPKEQACGAPAVPSPDLAIPVASRATRRDEVARREAPIPKPDDQGLLSQLAAVVGPVQRRLPLPSAAPDIAGLAGKLELTHMTADCLPAFDLRTSSSGRVCFSR